MDEQKPLHKKIMPYLAAMGTVLFWASAFPAVKFALDYFSAGGLMLYRFLIASAVLAVYCLVKKVPLPNKKDLPLFVLCGFIGLFLYMWAFNAGTNLVPSGVSGFIIASAPVFTLIFSITLLKERATGFTWLGVIISFIGIIVIAFTQMSGLTLNLGVWLLLTAAISASLFIIIQRHLLKKYTAMQVTAYPIITGTAFMLIFAPALLQELPAAATQAHLVVAYLGIFPAATAYFLWGYALAKAEKTIHITSTLYLSPFLASLIAFLWLNETLPWPAILGGIVVVTGMIITKK
jgi:drug/metabolite transporter (DMT)-like permease